MHAKPFQKILVATDFSEESQTALRQAIWLARAAGSEILVAHVIANVRRAMESMTPKARWELVAGNIDVFEDELRRESDVRLIELLNQYREPGVEMTRESLLGVPFISLIHEVQKRKIDLVVMGTRGATGLKRWLVGSTALRVVRNCPSAVWIVRGQAAQVPKVILAATDFSDPSRQAIEHAQWLADAAGAALHVLYVVESSDLNLLDRWKTSAGTSETAQLSPDHIGDHAESRLKEFVSGCSGGQVKPNLHVAFGNPWDEIGMLARRLGVDLISMGTTGRSGIGGLLLGNTAEKVLDTVDCSLLTFKPTGFVSPVAPSVLQ